MHPSKHARSQPEKIAYRMAASGETVTYAQLEKRSNQGAHLLRSLGLLRGDGIALMLENNARFFEIVWAAQRAGLYYTCLSTRLSDSDIAFILQDSNSRILISSRAPDMQAIPDGITLFAPGGRDFVAERAKFPETPIEDESPGNDMLYSSGTTGRPKGIRPPLPTGSLDQSNALTDFGVNHYGMTADTTFLSPAPLYHAAPLRWCMSVNKLGGTVIVMEKFDAEEALALIDRFAITHGQFVPTHFLRMLKLPEDVRSRYDVSSLEVAFHAAAPCPVEVKRAMLNWFGPVLHEFYAGTEANGLTAIGPEEWLERPGSVGRAVWGELRICDDEDQQLPPGEVGSIYFANGPEFIYHNDPDKTAASRNSHGWTTLGDVGRVDEDGYLFLADRQAHVIISGGVNIYPQEIEDRLITHPAIADIAVIGVADAEMGERVVAVVQLAEDVTAGPDLAENLRAHTRKELGSIKTPSEFVFRDHLPREPTGKLVKRRLVEEFERGA